MEKFQFLTYQISERTAQITLNRPEKRNALNSELVTELTNAFSLAESDESVKIVVLRANGAAFCAGADLDYLQKLQTNSFEDNLADSQNLAALFKKIYELKKVVVALVQGHALAGGAGLAAVCDFVFSVPEAKFGFTEVGIGFVPAIVSIFLLRKAGEARAKELLLTGKLISAQEAVNYGLVNFVVSADTIEKEVDDFALKLSKSASSEALNLTKQLISKIQDLDYETALEFAANQNAHARATTDCRRGIAAFLNKEKIEW